MRGLLCEYEYSVDLIQSYPWGTEGPSHTLTSQLPQERAWQCQLPGHRLYGLLPWQPLAPPGVLGARLEVLAVRWLGLKGGISPQQAFHTDYAHHCTNLGQKAHGQRGGADNTDALSGQVGELGQQRRVIEAVMAVGQDNIDGT